MSRRFFIVFVSAMSSACVQAPDSRREDAGPSIDAGWPKDLAIDAGAPRPPTGEPYLGPECEPAASASGGVARDGLRDGGSVVGDASVADSNGATPPSAAQGAKPGVPSGAGATDAGLARHPRAGEIVITEIMSNPAAVADTAGEWFELHNPSASEAFDLGGCDIDDGAAKPHAIPGPFPIGKDEYVVVGRGAVAGLAPDLVLTFSLGNAEDTLVLRCDGREVDRVAYGDGFPLAAGASMALDPSATADDNDAASAWCLGQADYGGDRGTPGTANPVCDSGMDSAMDAGMDAGME